MENKILIENEIKELIAKYAMSIDKADPEIAGEVWLNSAAVTFIHPKGNESGFEDIKNNFIVGTFGRVFSERSLKVYDLYIQIYNDTVIAEFKWLFNARFKEDGAPHETKGRESQVYIKDEENRWRLVHVHYSGMPVTGEREGF